MNSRRRPLNLQRRLLLAFLIVLAACLLVLFIVGWVAAPQFFNAHLDRLARTGADLSVLRDDLEAGFEFAWVMGTICALLVGCLVAATLSLYVSRRVFQPLAELSSVAERFGRGQWHERAPCVGVTEIDRLANSFNVMAGRLESIERRRLDLIADLTHELRTPLTIVGGYLEGLTDGSVEADPELFARLSRETHRVRRLVNDLQELSRVEAGNVPMHRQPVAMHRLVEEVFANFATSCPKKDRLCSTMCRSTCQPSGPIRIASSRF